MKPTEPSTSAARAALHTPLGMCAFFVVARGRGRGVYLSRRAAETAAAASPDGSVRRCASYHEAQCLFSAACGEEDRRADGTSGARGYAAGDGSVDTDASSASTVSTAGEASTASGASTTSAASAASAAGSSERRGGAAGGRFSGTSVGAAVVYTAAVAVRSGVRGQRVGYGIYYGPGHGSNAGYAVTDARATLQRGYLLAAVHALASAGAEAGAPLAQQGEAGAREAGGRPAASGPAAPRDDGEDEAGRGSDAARRRPSRVHVVTPSLYAANCVRQYASDHARRGWKTRDGAPVKNEDLLRALHAAMQRVRATADHVPEEVGARGVAMATDMARAAINCPLVLHPASASSAAHGRGRHGDDVAAVRTTPRGSATTNNDGLVQHR